PPAIMVQVKQGKGEKGDKGDKGDAGSGGSVEVDVVATEDIDQYDVVTGDGHRATSNTIAYRNKLIGVAKNDIANGFSGEVQTGGKITNSGWNWVAGDRIYLNGFALSTTAPSTGYCVQIGIAAAADTINIEIQPSILL